MNSIYKHDFLKPLSEKPFWDYEFARLQKIVHAADIVVKLYLKCKGEAALRHLSWFTPLFKPTDINWLINIKVEQDPPDYMRKLEGERIYFKDRPTGIQKIKTYQEFCEKWRWKQVPEKKGAFFVQTNLNRTGLIICKIGKFNNKEWMRRFNEKYLIALKNANKSPLKDGGVKIMSRIDALKLRPSVDKITKFLNFNCVPYDVWPSECIEHLKAIKANA